MSMTTVIRSINRLTLIGWIGCVGLLMATSSARAALLLEEGFNDISTLASAGWVQVNNSTPGGSTDWFQGNPGVFTSQAGASDAYIAANFFNAGSGGTISNWLISPELTLKNGDAIEFYTRTDITGIAADRLQVLLSTNGASINAGSDANSVGDFTTLLLDINALLAPDGYPDGWSGYSLTLSGLGGPISGRFAFRYFVPNTDINGNYIGIDTVSVRASATSVPEPATLTLLGIGVAGLVRQRRRSIYRIKGE